MVDNLSREDRSHCMSRIRSRHMRPERIVRSVVHRMGYRFRLHRKGLPGSPDLVLPRHHAVIFVHGCFWHWHPDPTCPIAGLPQSNLDYWKPKLSRTRLGIVPCGVELGEWQLPLVPYESSMLRHVSNQAVGRGQCVQGADQVT